MKESIGGIFLFNIVILFILLFTGIMSVTINRSNAIAIKDEVLNIIERYNGVDLYASLDDSAGREIIETMELSSYRATGTCPAGSGDSKYYGYIREGSLSSELPSICIRKITVNSGEELEGSGLEGAYNPNENKLGCYYSIVLFYALDIPVMKEVFNFTVNGETKILYGSDCEG